MAESAEDGGIVTADNLLVLGILALAVVLFVTEELRVDVVAMVSLALETERDRGETLCSKRYWKTARSPSPASRTTSGPAR
jgi:hypothetical protein